jgi:predicted transcriptional regulator
VTKAGANTRQEALRIIKQLPDHVAWKDIAYQCYLMDKIEAGLRDIENGQVYTHEQVKAKVKEWQRASRRRKK